MILAATPWLSISINLLLVVFVVVCILMTLMILMQRPKQEGLGAAFGGGMTDQMFGARTTNVLQRATVWCASLFFILALTLAILIGMRNSRDVSLAATETAPTETADSKVVRNVTINEDGSVTDGAVPGESEEEMADALRSLLEDMPPEEGIPVEDAPAEDAPAEDAPAEDAPAEDAPAEDAPAEEPVPEESGAPVDAEEEAPAETSDTEENPDQP